MANEASIIDINGVEVRLCDDNAREIFANAKAKNGLFRGKNFGSFNASQLEAFLTEHRVADGVFKDLFIGDSFTLMDGTYNAEWVIAGFNTEYNKGETAFTRNHIVCIPKSPSGLLNAQMNSSNTIEGGFVNTAMWKTTIPAIVANLQKVCGAHLLQRQCLLSNASSSTLASMSGSGRTGATTSWAWTNAYAVLMSEIQVYGSIVHSSSFFDIGDGYEKLPYFNFVHPVDCGRATQWLRGAAASTTWCIVYNSGLASDDSASSSRAVRPLICLG